MPFCGLPESVRKQYHTVTDIHDRHPNNFYLDNQRTSNTINNHNPSNYILIIIITIIPIQITRTELIIKILILILVIIVIRIKLIPKIIII